MKDRSQLDGISRQGTAIAKRHPSKITKAKFKKGKWCSAVKKVRHRKIGRRRVLMRVNHI